MATKSEGAATDHLSLASACVLAHALVATQVGPTPVLHIKGPAADHHGLRPPRTSADADVLVHPDAVGSVLDSLRAVGWDERATSALGGEMVTHSATLIHAAWPCDIDLHWEFPGLLAPPGDVFETLWESRVTIDVAGRPIAIPDRAGAILIQAAHALRTISQTPRHREEFRYLVDIVVAEMPDAARTELVDLASRLGAVDTLRPFLEQLGVALPAPTPAGVDPALDAWRERVASQGIVGARVVAMMRGRSLRGKVRLLADVVWAPERDFRLDHPEVGPGGWALLRARVARYGRGVRSIPAVARGRRASRRGVTEASLLEDNT